MTTMHVLYLLINHDNKPIKDLDAVHVLEDDTIAGLRYKIRKCRPKDLADVQAVDLVVWRCKNEVLSADALEDCDSEENFENFTFSMNSNDFERIGASKSIGELKLANNETLLVQVPCPPQREGHKRGRDEGEPIEEHATKRSNLDNHQFYGVEWTRLKDSHKWSLLWKRTWNRPLGPSFTEIPSNHSAKTPLDGSFPEGDLLPGRPELKSFMNPARSYLVRAEYIRVYNFIHNSYDEWDTFPFPPAAIITGPTGIGKTTWIDYALQRQIADGKATLLRHAGRYYLFGPDGVYTSDKTPCFEYDSSSPVAWCFVDAADAPEGPPMELNAFSARVFAIYVTTPAVHRWSDLHQLRRSRIVYMNYWCWDEMKYAMRFYPGCKLETVRARFDDLGPTPRHCLEFNDEQAREYRTLREWKISRAPKEILRRLTQDLPERLSLDDVSSEYCLIRRQFLTSPDMWPYVTTVTSPTVATMIRNRLSERDQSRRC